MTAKVYEWPGQGPQVWPEIYDHEKEGPHFYNWEDYRQPETAAELQRQARMAGYKKWAAETLTGVIAGGGFFFGFDMVTTGMVAAAPAAASQIYRGEERTMRDQAESTVWPEV